MTESFIPVYSCLDVSTRNLLHLNPPSSICTEKPRTPSICLNHKGIELWEHVFVSAHPFPLIPPTSPTTSPPVKLPVFIPFIRTIPTLHSTTIFRLISTEVCRINRKKSIDLSAGLCKTSLQVLSPFSPAIYTDGSSENSVGDRLPLPIVWPYTCPFSSGSFQFHC